MKKTLILLLTISSVFMTSCNEETFLQETPKDNIFAENLFLNYGGFVNGLNALYALVRQDREAQNNTSKAALWQMGTDVAFVNGGAADFDCFNNYNTMYSDNNLITANFNWLYKIVNSANLVIHRAETTTVDWQGGSVAADLVNKNKVIAQAKLMRAWAYRHLRYGWGAVPLSLDEIDGTNYRNDWSRNTIPEINAQMEKDLLFARDNLKMKEATGLANAAVAGTMLSELYLDMNENGKAEVEALKVINAPDYQLMTTRFGVNALKGGTVFTDLFLNPTPELGNKEVLWVMNNAYSTIVGNSYATMKNVWQSYYSKDSKLKNYDLTKLYTYNGGKGAGRVSVTNSAFGWYEAADDRYSEYAVKKYYIFPADAAATTFTTIGTTTMVYTSVAKLEDNFLWPWVRKWEYVDPLPANAANGGQYNDMMFTRLAETYLLAAEAMLKNSKPDLAATYLTKLRARSKATAVTAANVTMDFILKERSRELVSEEYRKHTLVRTGTFYDRTLLYNPRLDATKINKYNEYFPIPQSIIDANTGAVMPQNPGYPVK